VREAVLAPVEASPASLRPGPWLIGLAVLSFVLAIITGPEQFYYVLFAINPHLFDIGPNTNFMGEIWYAHVLNGDNSYTHFDAGLFTGAVEDAFMLAPCYLVCGIGLLRRSRWIVPLGLFTAGMIGLDLVRTCVFHRRRPGFGAEERDQ
jgi:hypothetical protein